MVWVNHGLLAELGAYIPPASGFMVGLYINNHAPVKTDTLAAFNEANFPGYARQSPDNWGAPFINGAGQAEVDGQNCVFIAGPGIVAAQSCYGYFVVDSGGQLIFAELFGLPATFQNPGDQVTLFTAVKEDDMP